MKKQSSSLIRVPLGDLPEAFANPVKYARSFRPGRGGGGPSKYGMFQFAIGEYHKTGDGAEAERYLERVFLKNFSDLKDLPAYRRMLQDYIREFGRTKNAFVKARDNISLPKPAEYSDFIVSGQAARIDLLGSGGYGVWMFVRDLANWERDPRFPLLQFAYAEKLGVPLDEVTVGVYDFGLTKHASRSYGQRAIDGANKNLITILDLLKKRRLKP